MGRLDIALFIFAFFSFCDDLRSSVLSSNKSQLLYESLALMQFTLLPVSVQNREISCRVIWHKYWKERLWTRVCFIESMKRSDKIQKIIAKLILSIFAMQSNSDWYFSLCLCYFEEKSSSSSLILKRTSLLIHLPSRYWISATMTFVSLTSLSAS